MLSFAHAYSYSGILVHSMCKLAHYHIKWYNPSTKKVETLAGDGSEGAQDGTEKSCSFVQVHGICSVSDTLFTTDAAAGRNQTYDGFVRNNRFFKGNLHYFNKYRLKCLKCTY